MKKTVSTTEKIKSALYEILLLKTIEETEVSEICEKASVSRRTFYNHYSDKYVATEDIFKSLFDKYVYISSPLTFRLFVERTEVLAKEHLQLLKNTIYFTGQNSLENAFAENLQYAFFQILDDAGWKQENDPFLLCSLACNELSHTISRLLYVMLSDYKYDTSTDNPTKNTSSLSGFEIMKSLVPVVLTKYFF